MQMLCRKIWPISVEVGSPAFSGNASEGTGRAALLPDQKHGTPSAFGCDQCAAFRSPA
jgi:hypothetical protein